MMNFVFIDTLGLNITFDLIALQRNSQRYSTLLYQHEGILSADQNKIGNASSVVSQFNAFFAKAKEKNADLALTPEYSCPWEIISSIISTPAEWPNEGKLWVIGCESITIESIKQIKTDFNRDNSIVYYDESVHNGTQRYLDPLIYLFQAENSNVSKLVVLIQFKTHHMGVWSGGDVERNNLIQGRDIYIIRNSINSIYFMSLICSEALNFSSELDQQKKQDIDWEDKPYLIFNPQLNPEPTHADFIAFRKYVFQSNDKEVISLNWQINSKIGNTPMLRHNCSRSGLYVKSNEINLSDRIRIINNHKKGLYYFNNKKNRHTYLLSSASHCFLIEMPPVKISNAQQAQIRRDGPEIIETFSFNDLKNSLVSIDNVNDEHINYINSTGCENQFLLNPNKCVLEKERLVCISTGAVNGDTGFNWWKIENITSIIMEDNHEINGRITVARNSSTDSIDRKTKFIDAVNELKTILDGKVSFPDSISDLKDENLILSYYNDSHEDNFRYNITTTEGERKIATIAYVGSLPDPIIDQVYSNLRELFDNRNKDIERVVVFYKRGTNIQAKGDSNAANVIDTNDYDDTSILKESDE